MSERVVTVYINENTGEAYYVDCPSCHFFKNQVSDIGRPCRNLSCTYSGVVIRVPVTVQPPLPDDDGVNPWLPEPPADGQHEFRFGSYRCTSCGVYNVQDPDRNPPLYAPCEGRWAQSGKMRAWAEAKWAEEKRGRDA